MGIVRSKFVVLLYLHPHAERSFVGFGQSICCGSIKSDKTLEVPHICCGDGQVALPVTTWQTTNRRALT